MNHTQIEKCRACNCKELINVFEMGDFPLANGLENRQGISSEVFPLNLVECNNCRLLQLSVDVSNTLMFGNYDWVTGTSLAARKWSKEIFETTIGLFAQSNRSEMSVAEIASNDGTFLVPFFSESHKVLGIEPAKNLCEVSNKKGVKTLNRFFDSIVGRELTQQYGEFDFVMARNVLAHVSNPTDMLLGMKFMIGDSGLAYIEVHDANSIYKGLQYDAIYHEHASYFSASSLSFIFDQLGLAICKVIVSPIGGGNLGVFFASKKSQYSKEEQKFDIPNAYDWAHWRELVGEHRKKLVDILQKRQNQTGVVFGASARGSTLLNYCKFNTNNLIYVLDNNPMKQGKFSPGVKIPIVDVNTGMRIKPSFVFCLAWNFIEEVLEQLDEVDFSGELIVPFPEIKVISV